MKFKMAPKNEHIQIKLKSMLLSKRKPAKTTSSNNVSTLATKNGRPFDLRVMVQRHPNAHWQVTGMLAKVAGKGFIVTNIRRSGGKVVTVENAIRHSELQDMQTSALLAELACGCPANGCSARPFLSLG